MSDLQGAVLILSVLVIVGGSLAIGALVSIFAG